MRRYLVFGVVVGMFLVNPGSGGERAGFSLAAPGEAWAEPTETQGHSDSPFPLQPNSVRFAVIGDSGTGNSDQYEVADQMAKRREKFPFDHVIMLGDNIYGGGSPRNYAKKFEAPYKPLLDAGVTFYASLGNHDDPSERFYKPFNMNGQRYYTFKKGNVRFFALDSNYMDDQQLEWLEKQLRDSSEHWKICFFHHPMYSDGHFHGPDLDLRAHLEPLFEKYGVNVSFSGHDHVYERIKRQHGVDYFVLGNAGELRAHDLRPSSEMAMGFDTDRAFMMVEIAGDEFHFQTISRAGEVADSGVLLWQKPIPPKAAALLDPAPFALASLGQTRSAVGTFATHP